MECPEIGSIFGAFNGTADMPIEIDDLKPEAYYWASRIGEEAWQIVQISTVFGSGPEFLTVARMGTDEHSDLKDFIFLEVVEIDGDRLRRLAG